MPKPQEYTDTFILIKTCFLVGIRGLQSMSNPVERPCTIFLIFECGKLSHAHYKDSCFWDSWINGTVGCHWVCPNLIRDTVFNSKVSKKKGEFWFWFWKFSFLVVALACKANISKMSLNQIWLITFDYLSSLAWLLASIIKGFRISALAAEMNDWSQRSLCSPLILSLSSL